MSIFTKLEIDVMQANELKEAVELAFKYNFPAIVAHQGLAGDIIRARGAATGRFKIIMPIDWSKGENFGSIKFRGLSIDALEADGFEIMLTGGKNEYDTKKEAVVLTDFVKRHLGDHTEVRFVLGTSLRSDETIQTLCKGLVGVRNPAFIRTDTQLKLQVSKANTDEHNRYIKMIRDTIAAPIKLSGNITGVRCITGTPIASRYAVSLTQAKIIAKEFMQQPEKLKDLLVDKSPTADVVAV